MTADVIGSAGHSSRWWMPDRRSSFASLARKAVIISNGLTSAAMATRMPDCLRSAIPLTPPWNLRCASTALSARLSLHLLPCAFTLHSLSLVPAPRHPSFSQSHFLVSPFHSNHSRLFPRAVSEARPLIFLLFSSRLRLHLVITTNLSRINSPSGINSSAVQAEKEKVIAGKRGTDECVTLHTRRTPWIRLVALCPLWRETGDIVRAETRRTWCCVPGRVENWVAKNC